MSDELDVSIIEIHMNHCPDYDHCVSSVCTLNLALETLSQVVYDQNQIGYDESYTEGYDEGVWEKDSAVEEARDKGYEEAYEDAKEIYTVKDDAGVTT